MWGLCTSLVPSARVAALPWVSPVVMVSGRSREPTLVGGCGAWVAELPGPPGPHASFSKALSLIWLCPGPEQACVRVASQPSVTRPLTVAHEGCPVCPWGSPCRNLAEGASGDTAVQRPWQDGTGKLVDRKHLLGPPPPSVLPLLLPQAGKDLGSPWPQFLFPVSLAQFLPSCAAGLSVFLPCWCCPGLPVPCLSFRTHSIWRPSGRPSGCQSASGDWKSAEAGGRRRGFRAGQHW